MALNDCIYPSCTTSPLGSNSTVIPTPNDPVDLSTPHSSATHSDFAIYLSKAISKHVNFSRPPESTAPSTQSDSKRKLKIEVLQVDYPPPRSNQYYLIPTPSRAVHLQIKRYQTSQPSSPPDKEPRTAKAVTDLSTHARALLRHIYVDYHVTFTLSFKDEMNC